MCMDHWWLYRPCQPGGEGKQTLDHVPAGGGCCSYIIVLCCCWVAAVMSTMHSGAPPLHVMIMHCWCSHSCQSSAAPVMIMHCWAASSALWWSCSWSSSSAAVMIMHCWCSLLCSCDDHALLVLLLCSCDDQLLVLLAAAHMHFGAQKSAAVMIITVGMSSCCSMIMPVGAPPLQLWWSATVVTHPNWLKDVPVTHWWHWHCWYSSSAAAHWALPSNNTEQLYRAATSSCRNMIKSLPYHFPSWLSSIQSPMIHAHHQQLTPMIAPWENAMMLKAIVCHYTAV